MRQRPSSTLPSRRAPDRAPGSTHLGTESRPASSSFWTARMTRLFMKVAVFFALFNLLCLVYVGAKRWAHGRMEGRLGRFLTRGLDYAPILLFFACLGLFVTYAPFAEAFGHST